MPIYNSERFLEKSIKSIIDQTYSNWELILINDGSKDGSQEIMGRYCEIDTRIRCFSQENKGVSSARNHGLDVARGDYIMFVDSDDEIASETLEVVYNIIDSNPCDVVTFNTYRSDVNSNVTGVVTYPFADRILYLNDEEQKAKYIYSALASDRIFGIMGNFVAKRELVSNIRFRTDMVMYEDLIFDICMYENAKNIVCLNKYFYYYRDNPSGCVSNFNYKKLENLKIAYEEKKRLIDQYKIFDNEIKIAGWFCLTVLFYYMDMIENKVACSEFRKFLKADEYILDKFEKLKLTKFKMTPTPKYIFGNGFERLMLRWYFLFKKGAKKILKR